MNAVEMHYTVQEVALLVRLSEKTVTAKMKAGDFGRDVANVGTVAGPDYRIPASGINAYLASRRILVSPGIAARTTGELRRRVFSQNAAVLAAA